MITIATICARGGSVGVPGKNIRPLLGKPLIEYTIEQARTCKLIDRVFVSTDDPAIADVAVRAGATVPGLRPAELATSETPKLPVIEHLVRTVEGLGTAVGRVVDLDPTSPLRTVEDIELCIGLLDEHCGVVITGYPAEKNPYFNMVEINSNGYADLVKHPLEPVTGRQADPPVFALNASIYVWHRHTLGVGIWGNRPRLYVMTRERSIDIDSPIDFKLVELLLQERAGA